MQIIFVFLCLFPLFAEATTYNRPYSSSIYNGGSKAIGPYVNNEFQSLANFINGGNIASGNIATFGVYKSNLYPANIVITDNSSLFRNTGVTPATITNLSTTITTSGRPVWVSLQGGGSYLINGTSTTFGYIQTSGNVSNLAFIRDSSTVVNYSITKYDTSGQSDPCSAFSYMDYPTSSTTYTYTIKVSGSTSGTVSTVAGCKLVVQEM